MIDNAEQKLKTDPDPDPEIEAWRSWATSIVHDIIRARLAGLGVEPVGMLSDAGLRDAIGRVIRSHECGRH